MRCWTSILRRPLSWFAGPSTHHLSEPRVSMLSKRWTTISLLTIAWTAPVVAQHESSRGDPTERAPVVAAKWPFRFGKNLFSQQENSKDPFLAEGATAQEVLARHLSPAAGTMANAMPPTGFEQSYDRPANGPIVSSRPYPWPAPVVTQQATSPASHNGGLSANLPNTENVATAVPPIPASTTTTWGRDSVTLQARRPDSQATADPLSSAQFPKDYGPPQIVQTRVMSADEASTQMVVSRTSVEMSSAETAAMSADLDRYSANAPAPASYPRSNSDPAQAPQNAPATNVTAKSSRRPAVAPAQYTSPAPRFSPETESARSTPADSTAQPAANFYQARGPSTLPLSAATPDPVARAVHDSAKVNARSSDFVPAGSPDQHVAAVGATESTNLAQQPAVGPIDQDIWGPAFATQSAATNPPKAVATAAQMAPTDNGLLGSNSQNVQYSIRRDPRVALLDVPELQSQSQAIDVRGTPDEGTDVLAVVGNQSILKGDVLGQVNEQLAPYREQVSEQELATQRELIIQQLLPRLIEQKLIFFDFLKAIPVEKLPELEKVVFENFNDKKLPEILTKTGLKSGAELDAKLRELGSSLATQQRLFFEQMLAAESVNRQVERNPEVSHEELLEYYNQHASKYEFPAKVRWEQLTVQADTFPSWQQAYNALVQMGNAVKQGAAFEQVAAGNSHGPRAATGGQYDWTTQGSLVAKEIDRVLFSIKPGELSKIISDGGNYYIVRVKERTPAGRKPFTSVQAEIKSKIQDQRFQAGIQEYVNRLRRETYVWTRGNGDVVPSQFTEPTQP